MMNPEMIKKGMDMMRKGMSMMETSMMDDGNTEDEGVMDDTERQSMNMAKELMDEK